MTPVSFENVHLPVATHYGFRHYQQDSEQRVEVAPHFHLMYELMWFRKVSGSIRINEQRYEIGANSLLFVPSLLVHDMRTDAARQEFFLLQYSADLYADLSLLPQQQPLLMPLVQTLTGTDAQHLDHLASWLGELDNGPEQLSLKQSVMRTLLLLVGQLQQAYASRHKHAAHQQHSCSKILPLIQRLESDSQIHLTLDQAADFSGMSRYHFSRSFKKLLGQNFKDYLLKRKLSAAVSLLVNSQLTIAEIAYRCEFTDSAYFCAKFKQQMGQTPRQFRSNILQANEFAASY
ncbi:AraC family transcriptional regulator [Neiella marina]|uniref:AraC family transcriptional regulator n=1 Tax=Neiella holothuriorum TaxID=2870530 RepID=A0ABS7EIC7_9GAMM|nr:AraC family transcriptional regulator [Neiella holothuriorum]MBW8192108.1 AraC family transcriptional regulator [Neiella holothuriorum]